MAIDAHDSFAWQHWRRIERNMRFGHASELAILVMWNEFARQALLKSEWVN